ncbi:unnamed protein product [Onchocerca flexuosa]|uniref:Uncharacterized protein n=1 Tax=Onchocerca flexuosa TaxID=387005 RepID=A0A183I137_9BILA|nr:unnamed protein product [Onchocerca flexuosa]
MNLCPHCYGSDHLAALLTQIIPSSETVDSPVMGQCRPQLGINFLTEATYTPIRSINDFSILQKPLVRQSMVANERHSRTVNIESA